METSIKIHVNGVKDAKLLRSPFVLLEKLKGCSHRTDLGNTLKSGCSETFIHINGQNDFLSYFGLVPVENGKMLFSCKLSGHAPDVNCSLIKKARLRRNFCCHGFKKISESSDKTVHGNFNKNLHIFQKYVYPKKINGDMSPRVCLKKWQGGNEIKIAAYKFNYFEQSLIPKADDHSKCMKIPVLNGLCDLPDKNVILKTVTVSEPNSNALKICPREITVEGTNRKRVAKVQRTCVTQWPSKFLVKTVTASEANSNALKIYPREITVEGTNHKRVAKVQRTCVAQWPSKILIKTVTASEANSNASKIRPREITVEGTNHERVAKVQRTCVAQRPSKCLTKGRYCERKRHIGTVENNVLKSELIICVKKWEGKCTIHVSKEMDALNASIIPICSSHKQCTRVNLERHPESSLCEDKIKSESVIRSCCKDG